MNKVFALLLSLVLAACAGTPFKWNDARRVEAGMTKPEVTGLLGTPNRVSTTPNDSTRYVWVWVNGMSGTTRSLVVDFDRDGRVIKAPRIPDEFQD
ncbi:outer membrane protein assembly factor BamE domain-containing protein [Azospira oryzae]|uniref:outer membrane protein assembly factor BamE domain-containing protein n=1 Tax=Azospira oryzae TaxID=146939 RepID=UPI0005C2433C|nr:outer membrane protein assembly factor BamE [Azospira oryzae]